MNNDINFGSLFYSDKNNLLVFARGLTKYDKNRVWYTIVNCHHLHEDTSHCSIEEFKQNFKRVGWIEENKIDKALEQ